MSFKQKLKAAIDTVFKSAKTNNTMKKFEELKKNFQQPGISQNSSSKSASSTPNLGQSRANKESVGR